MMNFWLFWLCHQRRVIVLIPSSSHLNFAGLQSRRRPDGVLRRAHTRGPPHHAAAGLWEPLPGEEVLLHHPLMSRAQGAGSCLASSSSPHLKLPAQEALSWVFAPLVDTLLSVQLCPGGWMFSAGGRAKSATKLATQWACHVLLIQ